MIFKKRKVLLISYVWPPAEGVGVLRAMKFAKYLPEYGWQPMILTAKPESPASQSIGEYSFGSKVFRTEYKDVIGDIKSLFHAAVPAPERRSGAGVVRSAARVSIAREMISIPDEQIGWYKFAVEEGVKIIKTEGADLIFSTSPPETAHLIAKQLKRRYGIPWVADLRDLWAYDHFRPRHPLKKIILKMMEKNVLKDADAITTVSRPWAEKLRSSVRDMRDKIKVIENGYDEEDFSRIGYTKNDKLTISYTGKLHKEHQPIDGFFKALKELVREGRIARNKVTVKFYVFGYDRPDITCLARSYGLDDIVKEFERVSYDKSLEIQRSSDVLLFVQWQGEGGDGWYSAKLYDYIGARRPILALAERGGIVDELITKTSSGLICDSGHSLQEALSKLYSEYAKNGRIRLLCNEEETARHTRRIRTAQLADIFNSLTK